MRPPGVVEQVPAAPAPEPLVARGSSPAGGRVTVMLVVAVLLGACGGGDGDLVRYGDPEDQTLFALPSDWNLYPYEELATLESLPFVASVQGLEFPTVSAIGFDAGPVRDPSNLASDLLESGYPIGAASIRTVGEAERDFLSRYTLTQSVLPYRSLSNPQEITKEDFSFGNGYDGVRVLVSYTDPTGQQIGVAYLISVTDAEEQTLYTMVAGCSFECYRDNRDTIEGVVDSWLVNTRG